MSTLQTAILLNRWWNIFEVSSNKLIHLLDQFVPFKLRSRYQLKQPWLNRTIKQLSRRKQRCYNHAKSTKSPLLWQYYKTVKKDMQREKLTRIIITIFKMAGFVVKSLCRDNTGVPMLYNNGIAHSSNEAKANALNQYFCYCFCQR